MIAVHAFLAVEPHVARIPPVGIVLDTLFGPAEDFEFVSRTTPDAR